MAEEKREAASMQELTENIEKTTEKLVKGLDVSEDDFMDTVEMNAQATAEALEKAEREEAAARAEEMSPDHDDAEDFEEDFEEGAVGAAAVEAGQQRNEHNAPVREVRRDPQRGSQRESHSGHHAQEEHGHHSHSENGQHRAHRAEDHRPQSGKHTTSNRNEKQKKKKGGFFANLDAMDAVVGFTGVFVLLIAAAAIWVIVGARSTSAQVEEFAQLGQNLAAIEAPGEERMLAIGQSYAEAQTVEQMEEEEPEELPEYQENELSELIKVGLNMTSVEKDLKIKFVNATTGKLIPGVTFSAEIKGPDKSYNKSDDDGDGIIYLSGLTGGDYVVRITGPDKKDKYEFPGDQKVTVKKQIEYKKIDVADEIKKESEVNVAQEDTEKKAPVESVITDTVEWVESTKTPVGGDGNGSEYTEVKKADIPDPSATARAGFLRFSGIKEDEELLSATVSGNEIEETPDKPDTPTVVEVTSVDISGESTVKVGASITLTASVQPDNATDKTITWSSSDTAIASVKNGTVKGKSAGTVSITATAASGSSASMTVTVTDGKETPDTPASSLVVADVTVIAGSATEANYTAEGVDNLTFSVADTKIAKINKKGMITGIRAGSTTYTVSGQANGKNISKTANLTVTAADVSGISLDKTSLTMKVGDKVQLKASVSTGGYTGCLWSSSDAAIASVEEHGDGTVIAKKVGTCKITVCSSEDPEVKAVCAVTVTDGKDPKADTTTLLKDKNGAQLYIKDGNGNYVKAVVADYYKYDVFYRLNENVQYKYTGWQTIEGLRYYFDKDGNKVIGSQIIQGVKYDFGDDGVLKTGNSVMGIDVSKHNGNIDWNAVKNSGVSFVIIRCGFRGSATGVLVEDSKFKTNIAGATAAGLKVGIYFFSQAINRVEAVEEASMTIDLIKKYKITYPVFLDVEDAGGRADSMGTSTRTDVINAYVQTIRNSGYTAGVYANKTYLTSKINTGALNGCRIWLAQYAAAPSYSGAYQMWQYSSTGRVSGISGNVDLDISYLSY